MFALEQSQAGLNPLKKEWRVITDISKFEANMESLLRIKLRKIKTRYVYVKFLMDRGLGLLTTPYTIVKYSTFAGLFVELLNKAFGWGISLQATLIVTSFLAVFGILIGYLDIKIFHILQSENELATRLNPVIDRMSRRIAGISGKMNNQTK